MDIFNLALLKYKEKFLLKIIDWSQRHSREVERLTKNEVIEALKEDFRLDAGQKLT